MLEERGNSTELEFVSAREVDRLSETLRREIRRRGVDPETADDLVQESWLRTLRTPPTSRDGRRLGSWLRVVGQRLVSELRRSDHNRSRREREAARTEHVDLPLPDGHDSALLRMVAELAEPYREVVRLRFFEDLEVEEIAARLSRSPATVRSQLARGLERLRARLPEPRRQPGWLALGLLLRPFASRAGRRWALAAAGGLVAVLGLLWFLRPRTPSVDASTQRVAALDGSRREPGTRTVAREAGGASEAASAQTPAAAAPAAPRMIEGRVLTPEGAPQPFAELWSSTRTGPGTRVGSADASGRFRVEGVAAELFLWATAAELCPSRRVYLASIGPAARHDLVLTPTRGVLALTVLEPDGRPAAGVRVELDGSVGRGTSSVITVSGALEIPCALALGGTTDAAGRVTLLKPDREWLGVRAWRGAHLLSELTLDAAPGDEVRELVLPRPASLAGLVVDAAARPAAEAAVRVRQLNGDVELTTHTDAAGRFALADLVPGLCSVSVESRDGLDSGRLELQLADGQRAEPRLELGPQGTLAGRALDGGAPLAGARVSIFAAGKRGDPEQARVTTDAEGRFAFACTPGAEYWLELTAEGESLPCGWSASVKPGAARELELCVDPRLRARETLTLELQGADAEHAPALVELRCFQPHLSFEVPVDARMRVALDVPPLEYELVVWSPGLGAWNHKQRLSPAPGVQGVLLPRPGIVQLDVELPAGARFEAGINVAGFNPIGFEELGALACVREFERDASGRHLRAELYPGRHAWFVRPRGFVPEAAFFWVQPGELVELSSAPTPGVELELVLTLPRALRIGEGLALRADTPQGARELPSSGENRRLENGFAYLLTLPADARGLSASSRFGLEGRLEFAPGELAAHVARRRYELTLTSR